MKKSFMTRVLAVSLSAAMAFSMSSASNLMTASAASTVNLKTTFKTLKVNQTYKMTLKNNTLNWKITKVTTSNKKICTVYGKTASSVMLKGKGVGRAKIKVKVKTTKRKYPKNIKEMKCTVNVKAADPSQTTETYKVQATASGNTEVNVTFGQAVDNADIPNFTVSDNVQVTGVKLSDDKKSAVLTIAGAEYGKKYNLTVKGIQVAGTEQAEQTVPFETPASTVKYPVSLETDKETLHANGSTQTVVTFTIKDQNGNPIKDKGIEVAFSASLGTFAEQRVTVQDGVATNVYTAPTLMETQGADLRAVIVESTENQELLNINATKRITLSPNGVDTSVGAFITSITAPTADRVYAYFNQDVNAADFVKESTKSLDTSKFEAHVYSGVDNDKNESDYETDIVGVLPVPGESKALQLLVKEPMINDSNVSVKFKNKKDSSSLNPENTVKCKLTDARQPSVLDVTTNENNDIIIKYSEAMLLSQYCNGLISNQSWPTSDDGTFAADNPLNYKIDGRDLNTVIADIVPSGGETGDDTTGEIKRLSRKNYNTESVTDDKAKIQGGKYANMEDKRDEITIKLNVKGRELLAAGTQHTLTISNVGDWAAKTSKERNIANTQTMGFTLQEKDEPPTFTVDPQSPEQYKIAFNNDFVLVEANDTVKVANSMSSANGIIELQQRDGSSWKTISDGNGSGKNPISVSKVTDNNENNTYVVEVLRDWTDVYNTAGTRRNYYNYDLRLHVDAGRIRSLVNGKTNAEINVNLEGDIMKNMDIQSPVIEGVAPATDKNDNRLSSYNITFNEPVKMSASANVPDTLTPSQTQQQIGRNGSANMGVPAPSAQFINADGSKTVDGYITNDYFIDAYDKVINVEPSSALDPGEWRVVVSSVSDDYGNTTATAVHPVTVEGETTSKDFKILWAAVSKDRKYSLANMDSTGNLYGQYIFVKFNKPINLVGNSTNALTNGNYSLNGATLPNGTNISGKIQDYDDKISGITDSITITLPTGNYGSGSNYQVSVLNTILNVSKAITSQTGETLTGETHIRLPYNFGQAGSLPEEISSLKTDTDAVWGNDPEEQLKGGASPTENDYRTYYQNLKAALGNDKYRKVVLDTCGLDLRQEIASGTGSLADAAKAARAVFGTGNTLTINRAVDLQLNGNINGNVRVSSTDVVNKITLSGTGAITGIPSQNNAGTATLTVDTVNAGFENKDVTIVANGNEYAVNINDVCVGTFVNSGTISGDVNIADSNGTSFDNAAGIITGSLFVSTSGNVQFEDVTNISDGIIVRDTAVVDLRKGAVLEGVKMTVTASNTRLIMDTTTKVDGATTIVAEAEDVRVTVPKSLAGRIIFLKGAKGTFKAVTAGNRDVTSSTEGAASVSEFNMPNNGRTELADVLARLDVYTGAIDPTTDVNSVTVTRSAITGGALSTALKETIAKNVREAVNDGVDSDDIKFELEVTYSLVNRKGLTQAADGTFNCSDANAEGKDEIKVTIQVKKKGIVVSEVVKTIFASKDGK